MRSHGKSTIPFARCGYAEYAVDRLRTTEKAQAVGEECGRLGATTLSFKRTLIVLVTVQCY